PQRLGQGERLETREAPPRDEIGVRQRSCYRRLACTLTVSSRSANCQSGERTKRVRKTERYHAKAQSRKGFPLGVSRELRASSPNTDSGDEFRKARPSPCFPYVSLFFASLRLCVRLFFSAVSINRFINR